MQPNASTAVNQSALRAFLGAVPGGRRFRLLLPEFGGPARLKDAVSSPNFQYRGTTFAERDARAASCVQNLLDHVAEMGNITLEAASHPLDGQAVSFLFGSRSNGAAQNLLDQLPNRLFEFEFASDWTIVCNQQRFSLPDPSVIDSAQYESSDDYGVIARIRSSRAAPAFIIAGLGGRATEGCGIYFRDHWEQLDAQFQNRDFAVVLKFSAPFDLYGAKQVARAS